LGAQCHPSSDSGCQLPDAASACMNDCSPVPAPAAEPALGVSASGLSGEASQPGLHAPAGALPPDPVRMLLRFGCIRSLLPRGRHRLFRSAIVGLAPRVLPLTPQAAFSSRSDDALCDASRPVRILSRLRGHHRAFQPGAFLSDRSIRDGPSPFSPPGCDTGRLQRRLDCSFSTAGWRTATLAHSSNFRLVPTVFAPCSETTERGA
jgi:hypothetical protein